jgi:hypothetical protein
MPAPSTERTPSQITGDVVNKREQILSYFLSTFARCELLFELLTAAGAAAQQTD